MNGEGGDVGEKRYIGVIDLDSFELQIYLQRAPEFMGLPSGVADRTGRIVSLSIEAKRIGVTRQMRVREALRICPEIHFFEKPERYNKPDSTQTRRASYEITKILKSECQRRRIAVEYVPNDQWFLDLTDYLKRYCSAFLEDDIDYDETEEGRVGHRFDDYCFQAFLETGDCTYTSSQMNRRINKIERKMTRRKDEVHFYSLAIGGYLLSTIVHLIKYKTKFIASAGVAGNLLQAKIACDYHKPEAVTILSESGLQKIAPEIQITSIPGLKKNLGQLVLERLNVRYMDELKTISESTLLIYFPPADVEKIYRASRGICDQVIQDKLLTNVVNCGKNNLSLARGREVRFHLNNLSEEMIDRLREELEWWKRSPKSLQISWSAFLPMQSQLDDKNFSVTFDYDPMYDFLSLAQDCFVKIYSHQNFDIQYMRITSLKLSAKHFDN